MKWIFFLLTLMVVACNDNQQQQKTSTDTLPAGPDTIITDIALEEIKADPPPPPPLPPSPAKNYANARFKDVIVERTGDHHFTIKGKAQVFEANISWVVEDGHEELKKGFQMTDAGAPAWGNFTIHLDVQKKRQNSTLILVLFESSPKDGSRTHELPITLY